MVDALSVRRLIGQIAALKPVADSLGEDDDLFAKGLSSFDSVQLMLALEEAFDVEFTDDLLNRKSFSSIRNIRNTIGMLKIGAPA